MKKNYPQITLINTDYLKKMKICEICEIYGPKYKENKYD